MRLVFAMSVMTMCGTAVAASAQAAKCASDNTTLKLPAGFCATIFADSVRGVRQMVVAPNGDLFASVMSTRTIPGGVVAFRDASHSGRATVRQPFATGFTSSAIALFDGYIYTESFPPRPAGAPNTPGSPSPAISILRYPLKAGELVPRGPPDTIVSGLPGLPGHSTRNFVITPRGVMYVNVGSGTNSCQTVDRKAGAPGVNPCTELETRAGVWRFDARKTHQTQASGVHFARGIRNAVGIALDPATGALWTTQHGRDDLGGWRDSLHLDSAAAIKYNAENPAEELLQPKQGEDYGWPYCYYSFEEHHLVLAPEYGGNGKKTAQCTQKKEPVAVFPGHWAPNALIFYTGSNFPARYKAGAFIAFHGSWNRFPEPPGGYNVVFQPLKNGVPSGKFEVFADGFSTNLNPEHVTPASGNGRPTGFAQGPDGALYVSDDAGGRIFKIVHTGK